jgi:hypothetical protein
MSVKVISTNMLIVVIVIVVAPHFYGYPFFYHKDRDPGVEGFGVKSFAGLYYLV